MSSKEGGTEGRLCWNFVRHWHCRRHEHLNNLHDPPSAIQLAAPPTDVPIPPMLLSEDDVLPWRLATNADHLGIQKPVQLLEPGSPSRTGGTLVREAWAPPGRVFERSFPRRGPPATSDFGSHAFERQCKVLTNPCHPSTYFHKPVKM